MKLKIMVLGGALALAGCVTATGTWHRIDGTTVDEAKLETDATICSGEVEKARLSAHRQSCGAIGCLEQEMEIKRSLSAVVKACMAERGYRFAQSP